MARKVGWRRRLMAKLLLLGCISWSAMGLTLKEGHPDTYTVKKGDTLWDISAYFLESPWLWPQLWQNNPAIENPHLIYPGDVLHLIWVNGQPRLSAKRLTKLSPTARVDEYKEPITVLDDQWLLPFMAQDRLLDDQAISELPRVIGTTDGRSYLTAFDDIMVDQALNETIRWGIFRPQAPLTRHDAEGKPNIYPLKHVAIAKVERVKDGVSIVKLHAVGREVQQNDVLLPMPNEARDAGKFTEAMTFAPAPAPEGMTGIILADLEGFRYQSHHQVVVIDRGTADGVHAGFMLQVTEPGAKVLSTNDGYKYQFDTMYNRGGKALDSYGIGEVMVIRPYSQFSLAVVTHAKQPLQTGAKLASPLVSE
ncbi:LysM peptidoglycan-binding domain-containing protein [Thaumasiovibrio subtropicus]|uniref:LysM peptidoglycan-binding domain-containing protein n=1 Tax=Thaumasiovibrio subtropicus TaxID=1891207 RepID=UPI000B34B58E|nr:LysM domain-containing protein [Thaumasiovibrio subtropicus]